MTTTRDANSEVIAGLNKRIGNLEKQLEKCQRERRKALDAAQIAQMDALEAQEKLTEALRRLAARAG